MRGFTAWARRGGFDIGVSSAKLTKAMEELEIDISGVGSTTLQLEVEDRGLEPDECYYIQNESRVRNEEDLDLTRDPPPDLLSMTVSVADQFQTINKFIHINLIIIVLIKLK